MKKKNKMKWLSLGIYVLFLSTELARRNLKGTLSYRVKEDVKR